MSTVNIKIEGIPYQVEAGLTILEAAKAAGKQFAAGFVPELYVQDSNRQFDCAILLERCLDDYRRKYGSARISSCKLYIKPEDNTVYYVINDIEDKLPL